MKKYEFSEHAYDMLKERNIQETWVRLTIENPEKREFKDDGTVYFLSSVLYVVKLY